MVQALEEQRNWWLVGKLSPSLFTENYLYKNGKNQVVELREGNSLFERKLSGNGEEEVMKYLEEADLSHLNYCKVYQKRREVGGNGGKYRVMCEVCPYKLIDLIQKTQIKRLSEEIARFFLSQLLDVLDYLHSRCVYYLTLRLEDFLLDAKFNLKLNNFCIPNAIIHTCKDWVKCISSISTKASFAAPEINSQDALHFPEKSVVFNIGVILFSMVVGFKPFRDFNTLSDFFYKFIANNDFKNYWATVQKATPKVDLSENFKDLVFKMLNTDIQSRIELSEIRRHPWFNSGDKIIKNNNKIYDFFCKLLAGHNTTRKRVKNPDHFPSSNATSTHTPFVKSYLKQFFENLKNKE